MIVCWMISSVVKTNCVLGGFVQSWCNFLLSLVVLYWKVFGSASSIVENVGVSKNLSNFEGCLY